MKKTTRETETISIYALIDPRTERVFYVGKTFQPLKMRLRQHIDVSLRHQSRECPRQRNARQQRICEICESGAKPSITLLEEVGPENWKAAELKWATHYQSEAAPLTNAMYQIGAGGTRSYVIEWTPELDARLGTIADSVLAEELGVTRKSVSYRREVLSIPASYDRTRNTPPPAGRKFQEIPLPESIIERLGTSPDYVLAAEIGVSKKAIQRRRVRLGIASYAAQTGNTGTYKRGNFPSRWRHRQA